MNVSSYSDNTTSILRTTEGEILHIEDDKFSSCLVGFHNQTISFLLTDLSPFFSYHRQAEEIELHENNLNQYFHMKNILSPYPSDSDILKYQFYMQQISANNQFDGDDNDNSSYCDDPTCIRRFPHQHVGSTRPQSDESSAVTAGGSQSRSTSKSLLTLGNTSISNNNKKTQDAALQIFPDNYFMKL
jgi:hypothetical protein